VQKIFLTKFAYNNSVYNITDMSFFFAIYEFHLNVPSTVRDDRSEREMPAAKEVAKQFESESKKLAERWQRVVEFQKKWYDKKYTPMQFSVRD
jgi:hypothetical protein